MTDSEFAGAIFDLEPDEEEAFDRLARYAFEKQIHQGRVYGAYCDALRSKDFATWRNIPFLPIEAFKSALVATFPEDEAEAVFESSGTVSRAKSRHFIRSLALYERSAVAQFKNEIGRGPFVFLAHLPEYEKQGARSSLLYMVRHLMRVAGASGSGFFLQDYEVLDRGIGAAERQNVPVLLFGAAFGLANLSETGRWRLPAGSLVVETGGMKTHRREMERSELQRRLAGAFDVPVENVRSEYGMCELLSQSYTRGGQAFFAPPWVRIRVVDPEWPDQEVEAGEAGLLAVVDLANLHTVSAILTEDLGRKSGSGFEVVGRLRGSDIRGCNYLVSLDG